MDVDTMTSASRNALVAAMLHAFIDREGKVVRS